MFYIGGTSPPCCDGRYYSGKWGSVWFNHRASQTSQWVPSVSWTLKVSGCFRNQTQSPLPESSSGRIQWWGSIWDSSAHILPASRRQTLEMRRCEGWKIARFPQERFARPPGESGAWEGFRRLQSASGGGLRHRMANIWVRAVESFICKAGESHPRLPKGSLMFPCLALRIQSCTGSRALPHSPIKAGATEAPPQAKLVPRCILSSMDRKPSFVVDIATGICVDGHKTAGKMLPLPSGNSALTGTERYGPKLTHVSNSINLSEAVRGRLRSCLSVSGISSLCGRIGWQSTCAFTRALALYLHRWHRSAPGGVHGLPEMLQANYRHISNNYHQCPSNETRGPEEG